MGIRNVTVFGGSGFVGRNVVRCLAEKGYRVRVACRDPEKAMHLKPMGTVGQIALQQANIRNAASVRAAVAGADAVINLTGILFERGHQTFDAVQGEGAANLAAAVAEAGIKVMVHVSAIGADEKSTSSYARAKAAGEAGVLAHMPQASIIRPSVIFGPEDQFYNLFGSLLRILPVLPLIGGGETRLQPVYVGDVAQAVVAAMESEAARGKTFELGGPQVYSFAEILGYIAEQTGRQRFPVPVPFDLVKFGAFFLQLLPRPLLTMDQVELLKSDNLASADLPGLADLGIAATPVEGVVPTYIARYRRAGKLTASRFG